MSNWFASLRHKCHVFRSLSWRARWTLLEAVCWLGVARGAVVLLPFKRIAPYLGQLNHETAHTCDVARQVVVQHVGWAIHRVSPVTVWQSNCLAQAIAGKMMLRRRGIASTLYLGVHKEVDQLTAHAWLRTGTMMVTGETVQPHYTVISSFGAPTP